MNYQSIGQRTGYVISNKKLSQYIDGNCIVKDSTDIREIIKTSLSLTSKLLEFTFSANDKDPNKLIDSKAANCIGYAAFFSTVCNYQLQKYNLSEQWTVSHVIGELFVFGTNVHTYFNTPFFKDHDFVIIENTTTKEIFAVDPTVNDYLFIDFVALKNDGE